MFIRKSDGAEQEFQAEKLARALGRARVDEAAANEIAAEVEHLMRPGTTTKHIHDRVLHALETRDPLAAARYNLKHSMMELGPSGFPFEKYFARLMEAYGWTAEVGVPVRGKCVMHEVDVWAERNGEKRAVEAKYHNQPSGRTDVKVALYVHARHLDLSARDETVTGVLVTNTQFTTDATAYGECVGMKMKAWNYPEGEGLAKYIEAKGLYPVTVFSNLARVSAEGLMKAGKVLASELCMLKEAEAATYGIGAHQLLDLQKRAKELCDKHGS